MRASRTSAGLRPFVWTLRASETGKKALAAVVDDLHIVFDRILPQYNYVLVPKDDWEVI